MNLIQLSKKYYIFLLVCFLFPFELKPSNHKDIIKINIDGKNRTYYHLGKNEELIYTFENQGIKDLSERFSLKTISRTVIASNSNSNKTFGIKLDIYQGKELLESEELTYNKIVSDATSDSKLGWNFTKAGFWFHELNDLKDKIIKISLIKGSPEIELKLICDQIKLRSSTKELKPINKNYEYSVVYNANDSDDISKTSNNWYLLSNSNIMQFKIIGPKIIRFISRYIVDEGNNDTDFYSFELRENGRFVSNYNYKYYISKSNAFIEDTEDKLSSYNSSFYNVPKGIHYYSFISNSDSNTSDEIYLKLEIYNENK